MKLRIKELREKAGLTQDALGYVTGVRASTISVVENNKGNPELATLQALADALGVHVFDLFETPDADPDELRLIEAFRRADPDQRAALLVLLGSRQPEGGK